jgi:hypothetical protein
MQVRFAVAVGIFALLIGGGCQSKSSNSGGQTKPSDEIITRKSEQRPIVGFNQITIKSPIIVHMMSGAQCTFSVSAPADVLPKIKTELDYGNLIVWIDGNVQLQRPVELYLSSVDLIGVNLSGAATADIERVKEKNFKVVLSGASVLNVKGRARAIEAELTGASKFDAGRMPAQEVKLKADGASRALVNCDGKLTVDADGASTVSYKGSPKVTKNENGASKVVPVAKSGKADSDED